ncbi:MAG TPA: alanine racemase [Actinomycetota bacterium]|nr:alanine racemase [Actinomycetota bacterium]
MTGFRPTWVEIDLDAIRHNAAALTPPGAALMAVVKADGYGHGAAPVARAALEAGATWVGVALVEEGMALRDAGIDAPILVTSEVPPGSEAIAIAARLTPTLYSDAGLARLAEAARGAPIAVHVKVDTGMHRVGVWPPEAAPAFAERVVRAGLDVEGLWTHFASSEIDTATTVGQLERFLGTADAVRAAGVEPRLLHAANSAATILHPASRLDLVRPGIALYGIAPAPGLGEDLGLRPALSWRSRVSFVKRLPAGERLSYDHRYELARDAWIATVPVGYADGLPRAATGAPVLIHGARHPIAGNVTMDQILVDCGDDEPAPGDEVTLVGEQAGATIGAWDLAEAGGTIAYEIVARVGARVAREHLG